MKEIQQHSQDQVKNVRSAEIAYQHNIVGRIRRIPGLILWKMSMKSGEIRKVEVEDSDLTTFESKGQKSKSRVKYESDHLYVQALNIKNAKRKFEKAVKELIQK